MEIDVNIDVVRLAVWKAASGCYRDTLLILIDALSSEQN